MLGRALMLHQCLAAMGYNFNDKRQTREYLELRDEGAEKPCSGSECLKY